MRKKNCKTFFSFLFLLFLGKQIKLGVMFLSTRKLQLCVVVYCCCVLTLTQYNYVSGEDEITFESPPQHHEHYSNGDNYYDSRGKAGRRAIK